MNHVFKGRAILPKTQSGEAIVSIRGFNAFASYFNSLNEESAGGICADAGNLEMFGKDMKGKIICLPKTTGSTSAGAIWLRLSTLGLAPKALLFAFSIDSLAAGGLIVADIWSRNRICTIDQLGVEFLAAVQDGDWLQLKEDGSVRITQRS
jgi:uncharacterized protein